MKINRQFLWKAAIITGAIVCFLVAELLWVLQSDWFRNQVKQRLVVQVEAVTGGKVEIAGFDYDWRHLTADLHGFVIHGTEPPSEQPLVRVENARVTVRIISILERSVDVSSIVLTRPGINLIVADDGSTNIPTPRLPRNKNADPIQEVFALKLKHFEIQNGLANVRDKRIPLNLKGDGVELTVDYQKAEPSYQVSLFSRQIDLGYGNLLRGPYSLTAQASLRQDRIILQKSEFSGAETTVSLTGTLTAFAHPSGDFQIAAAMPTDEIIPLVKFASIRGGKLTLRGNGSYDESNGWSISGRADARQAGYYSRSVTLKSVDASTEFDARKSGLTLRHLTVASRGAKFSGEATLKSYRNFSAEGAISGVTLKEVASFFTKAPLAWAGTAYGRIRVNATLDAKANDLALETNLTVSPASSGIPVFGKVQLNYLEKSNSIAFNESVLNFPHSTLAFSGKLRDSTQVVLDSTNLEDLRPIVNLIGLQMPADSWPVLLDNGHSHFDGSIFNMLSNPTFEGQLEADMARVLGQPIDEVKAKFTLGASGVNITSGNIQQGDTKLSAVGLLGFDDWSVKPESPLRAAIALRSVNVANLAAHFPQIELPIIQGIASGSLELGGTVSHPQGRAHISSDSLDAYGETLNQVQFDADLTGDRLRINNGRVVSGAAVLRFSGDYLHNLNTWKTGLASVKIDSNGFPLASLSPVRKFEPALNAQAELHFEGSARVSPSKLEPTAANGAIDLRNVTWNNVPYGDLLVQSSTRGQFVDAVISGDFRKNPLHGKATIELTGDNKTKASVDFDKLTVASVYPLTGDPDPPAFDGFLAAHLDLDGPLQRPEQFRAILRADQLQLSSQFNPSGVGKSKNPVVLLRNVGPLIVEAANGVGNFRSFQIAGDQTSLSVTGTFPLFRDKSADLHVTGSLDMHVYHLFDPNIESNGVSLISAAISGTLRNPAVNGTLQIKDASFFPENLSNGLSEVNGTVVFTRNRATLQKMTAKSGGGELTLGGFISFGGGSPLVYHLEGSADNVRVRYAGSISLTSSAKLRLSGTSTSSLLSGTITVSRVVFNPNTDVGNILAAVGGANGASSENDFLTGLRLDVVIESAPNLQLSTSLSRDVEAEIDLRLRGTPDHPVLLGTLSANQGDIQAFGSRFTINRGEISFVNPVKIEPNLDLDLETRARGITVDITVSGTFSKLNIAYRSDPPLQPREIIALLAVGQAPDSTDTTQTLRTTESNGLQTGGNSLLGALATSPVTNRLSKLFGITNIRIDPLVQGLTNTPQTRVSLEQQISRDITITYVTNLSQTSEQIFRFEWALSRQFSVVALRDDNGEFGIDFVFKKQFK